MGVSRVINENVAQPRMLPSSTSPSSPHLEEARRAGVEPQLVADHCNERECEDDAAGKVLVLRFEREKTETGNADADASHECRTNDVERGHLMPHYNR